MCPKQPLVLERRPLQAEHRGKGTELGVRRMILVVKHLGQHRRELLGLVRALLRRSSRPPLTLLSLL